MAESSVSVNSSAERVESILARYREPVTTGMRAALDLPGVEHTRYMRYHLGWEQDGSGSGKMLRPALCLLCCEAAGASRDRAIAAAIAIELLHNFTLIHDDIEDGSESRHGRETLWKRAGIAQAINAGDGLFVLARRKLLELEGAGVPPESVLRATRLLDDACVALCEGQYLDLSFESRDAVSLDEYVEMISGKTAALIAASCAIGALAGGSDERVVDRFRAFGSSLGLAFQIQDDVLGVWGDPGRTGKPSGDDIRSRKKSFPIVYALQHLQPEDRDTLLHVYAAVPSHADVAEIVTLLDRAGVREAAEAVAKGHAAAALQAIADLAIAPERRADLEALAGFVAARDV